MTLEKLLKDNVGAGSINVDLNNGYTLIEIDGPSWTNSRGVTRAQYEKLRKVLVKEYPGAQVSVQIWDVLKPEEEQ